MAKRVSIRAYTRRSKKQKKTVSVKSYMRRVGARKPKKQPDNYGSPGDELKDRMENKMNEEIQQPKMEAPKIKMPKSSAPRMTKEEIEAWDAAARRNTMKSYGSGKKETSTVDEKPKSRKGNKKSEGVFDKIENRLDKFLMKYGKRFKR